MVGRMARPLRVEYPGGFYHVINRGNAGGDIFEMNQNGLEVSILNI
jgi:hypothetical protein